MYSVLILEDEKIQRNAIELILKNSYPEWNVSCAASYHDAVSLLDTDNFWILFYPMRKMPSPDLILVL